MENELASKQFSMAQKAQDYELLKVQYESLKKSQLELVEMNKSILKKNQTDSTEIQKMYEDATKKLEVKSQKLLKYHDIVKTFNGQIKMFEDFQITAIKEID